MSVPRRHRRGLAALVTVVLGSIVLAGAFSLWSAAEAQRLRDLRVAVVAEWLEAEAAALHHWLHEAQQDPGFVAPGPDGARLLSAAERAALMGHEMRPAWLAAPPDWRIDYLAAMPLNQPEGAQLAHGLVVLEPAPGAPEPVQALTPRVCLRLSEAAPGSMQAAETLAAGAVGLDFGGAGCDVTDPGDAFAAFAWPHAGILARAVLREPRAGWPMLPVTTTVDMEGNRVTGAGRLETGELEADRITGAVTLSGELTTAPDAEAGATGAVEAASLLAGQMELVDRLEVAGPTGLAANPVGRIGVTGELVADTVTVGECLGC